MDHEPLLGRGLFATRPHISGMPVHLERLGYAAHVVYSGALLKRISSARTRNMFSSFSFSENEVSHENEMLCPELFSISVFRHAIMHVT